MLETSPESDLEAPALSAEARRAPVVAWRTDLRTLLLIAAPNVASTVAQALMSFVDYTIVSRLPNESAAQAAVTCGGMIFFLVFSFLLGMMICVTTVVSQSLGADRPRDCSAYAWQGIWLCVLFGIGGAALWPITPAVFRAIGHAPDVQVLEASYTQIRWLSLGAAGATVALAHYFNGIHHPLVNAVSMAAATVLNAVLTYGLVLGRFGLPAMGVAGAAWGTVIATTFRTVWLMAAMCLGRYATQFHARQTWRFDADKMRRLLWVGGPSGVAFLLDVGAWAVLFVLIVGQFGTLHLAAMATVWRFLELSFMPAIGIGIAVSTMVGRSIGEGQPHLARRRAAIGAVINMSYMGLMAAIYVLFGTQLMKLFCREEAVIALGAQLFIFAAIYQLFDGIGITYSNALRGAGDTRWPAVVGVIEVWSIMIVGGVWVSRAHPELGAKGPWMFATLFIIVWGLTFWTRWRRGAWERMDVIGRSEAGAAAVETGLPEPVDPDLERVPEAPAEPNRVGSPCESS